MNNIDYKDKLQYKVIYDNPTDLTKLLDVVSSQPYDKVLTFEYVLGLVRQVYPVEHDIFKTDKGVLVIQMLSLYNMLTADDIIDYLRDDNIQLQESLYHGLTSDDIKHIMKAINDNDISIESYRDDDNYYYLDENTLQRFIPMDITDFKNILKKVIKDIDKISQWWYHILCWKVDKQPKNFSKKFKKLLTNFETVGIINI